MILIPPLSDYSLYKLAIFLKENLLDILARSKAASAFLISYIYNLNR